MTAQTLGSKGETVAPWVAEVRFAMKLAALPAAFILLFSFIQDITGRDYFYVRLMDVTDEACPYTWISSICLFGSGAVAWRITSLRRRLGLPGWVGWALFTAFMLCLSAEEVVGIHERLSVKGDIILRDQGINYHMAWAAPALVLCAILVFIARPFLRSLPPGLRGKMLLAGAIYVGGAAGSEFIQSILYIFLPWLSTPIVLLNHLEEAMELTGAFIMLSTLVDYRAAQGVSGEPVD